MADNSKNMELEPPKKAEVRKIAQLDDNIDNSDNVLDIITQIVRQRSADLQVEEKNRESEEMSVQEHQERLKSKFSHDGEGSPDNEDLSDSDKSVSDIQDELSRRIFSN